MNQSSSERLGKFRQTMKDRGLDAWIGRIVDPHLSEYVPEHWQSVAWLTGFTGSTARLCVTQGAAALLVDSRYWEQAEGELDGAPFEVVRLGAPDAPRRRPGFRSISPAAASASPPNSGANRMCAASAHHSPTADLSSRSSPISLTTSGPKAVPPVRRPPSPR